MDVADDELMPPLLADYVDADVEELHIQSTSSSNSRKYNEASQANLLKGRTRGTLNKAQNITNPNYSRETSPGSMNNLQQKGRVRGGGCVVGGTTYVAAAPYYQRPAPRAY